MYFGAAGPQAFAQLWALIAVRPVAEVRSFSRNPAANADFVSRVKRQLGLDAHATENAETASRESDLLIVATGSARPVIQETWVGDATTIFLLGPKRRDACEIPTAILDRAKLLTSDSPAQIAAAGDASIVDVNRVVPLAHLQPMMAGQEDPGPASPSPETAAHRWGPQVYLSAGLAGTELMVAKALVARLNDVQGKQ
jgi:ornithine cyclodeaminase